VTRFQRGGRSMSHRVRFHPAWPVVPGIALIAASSTETRCHMAFDTRGDVESSSAAMYEDRPLLSLLTADPLKATKRALDLALYQPAVVLESG
jgi:hypothetical protein